MLTNYIIISGNRQVQNPFKKSLQIDIHLHSLIRKNEYIEKRHHSWPHWKYSKRIMWLPQQTTEARRPWRILWLVLNRMEWWLNKNLNRHIRNAHDEMLRWDLIVIISLNAPSVPKPHEYTGTKEYNKPIFLINIHEKFLITAVKPNSTVYNKTKQKKNSNKHVPQTSRLCYWNTRRVESKKNCDISHY